MLGADGSSAELSPEARTEEIFDKMDENRDGVLTRDEFMNGCLSDQYLLSMLLADEPVEWAKCQPSPLCCPSTSYQSDTFFLALTRAAICMQKQINE